jgi:hypothetical protein
MKEYKQQLFTGERALFCSDGLALYDCIFDDGESPVKESRNISADGCLFRWKYPFWYCKNVNVKNSTFFEMARAGIWYTENVSLSGCTIEAPKEFRRCDGVRIEDTVFTNAAETLWHCKNVVLDKVSAKGDYFAMNSENMKISDFTLVGNYSFDGAKNVEVRDARLLSKDAFWNSENVTVYDSFISGEYLGWNSKNLTLVNCTVESLQGLCYIENLKMINCKTINTTLALEYSTVDVDVKSKIDSVINPSGGVIRAESIGELIMDESKIDPKKTEIILQKTEEKI